MEDAVNCLQKRLEDFRKIKEKGGEKLARGEKTTEEGSREKCTQVMRQVTTGGNHEGEGDGGKGEKGIGFSNILQGGTRKETIGGDEQGLRRPERERKNLSRAAG